MSCWWCGREDRQIGLWLNALICYGCFDRSEKGVSPEQIRAEHGITENRKVSP